MIKVETRAKKGFEDLYDLVMKKLEILDEEIKKEFESRKTELVGLLEKVSEKYEVELDEQIEDGNEAEEIKPEETAEDFTIVV